MEPKFRPSFSTQEIKLLTTALENNNSAESVELKKKLGLILAKVDLGMATPAYTTNGLKRMAEPSVTKLSPNEVRQGAYFKWQHDPSSCTDYEVRLAFDYMYLANMLTHPEREDYELKYLS